MPDRHMCGTRQALRELVERAVPLLLAGTGAARNPEPSADGPLAERLAALRPADFARLLGAALAASRAALEHAAHVGASVTELLRAGGALRAEAAAAAAAAAEAVQVHAPSCGAQEAVLQKCCGSAVSDSVPCPGFCGARHRRKLLVLPLPALGLRKIMSMTSTQVETDAVRRRQ